MKREHREHIRFLPGAQDFLASVRARGKRLVVVTNAHRDTFAVKAEHTGIDRLVDSVVCSHDFAAPKENAAFWQALERHEPFDRAAHLLIEDSLAVLAAARAYGLRHTVAIRRPDSQLPPRAIAEFTGRRRRVRARIASASATLRIPRAPRARGRRGVARRREAPPGAADASAARSAARSRARCDRTPRPESCGR